MKLNRVLLFITIISVSNQLNAQSYRHLKNREESQNEVFISSFLRSQYDINVGLGYERNLFKIFNHSFVSIQGEYEAGLFHIQFDKYLQYFLIAPKYNFQKGSFITSLYPKFGYAPNSKRKSVSLNASNKFDYPKLKLTFSVNIAIEAISFPPTSYPNGNFNPLYQRTWFRFYRIGLSIGKYF